MEWKGQLDKKDDPNEITKEEEVAKVERGRERKREITEEKVQPSLSIFASASPPLLKKKTKKSSKESQISKFMRKLLQRSDEDKEHTIFR